MKWIWVRHGQTEANLAGRYLGHTDVALSIAGRAKAIEAANNLAQEPIVHIYASDLSRTMETAQRIGSVHRLTPVPVTALRELDFGTWDLCTYDEVMQTNPSRLQEWYDNPFDRSPPNGETLRQLGERFDRWLLERLHAHDEHETILCVTHGGPIRWFQSKWIDGDEKQFWMMPGIPCGGFFTAEWNKKVWKLT